MSKSKSGAELEPPSPSGVPQHVLEQERQRFQKKGAVPAGMNDKASQDLLWEIMSHPHQKDCTSIQKNFSQHVLCTLARTRFNLDSFGAYQAAAYTTRDYLIENWNKTQQEFTLQDVKRVYYLSLEFLMGRSLQNALLNMNLEKNFNEALMQLGYKLEDLYEEETDAALGNGGLGRLAACFVDSLATQNYPAWGYGIRYQYGMFKQQMINGYQAENPDYWLNFGNPWEIPRLDVCYPIRFYGSTHRDDKTGSWKWVGGDLVQAVAYDVPVPGHKTTNTINVRLWGSKPSKEFDLASFNEGDYFRAIQSKQQSENISLVLYPNDNTYLGKELRLKQQYFFVSATLRDILRRFKKSKRPLSKFPEQVAIQLNDTHPAISIVELMRILLDEEGMKWDDAWKITVATHAFTNHTVLPEALEKWSVDLMTFLLPRHMQIIYDINHQFLQGIRHKYHNDTDRLAAMSIIEESSPKKVRMAHLAIIGSHTVNGVAFIHSELIKTTVFKDFYNYYPEKFQNKTNGVTPRRWMNQCNPGLSALISTWLKTDDWINNLDLLRGLKKLAKNPDLLKGFAEVKRDCKKRLADYIEKECGITVSPDALFDVQVKRIHEYKRQLLNALGIVHRYISIKKATPEQRKEMVPHVFIFGGKAAPGYANAKRIIKLITSIGDVANNDPEIEGLLKVVFIPNYCVSLAEIIIPASDISEHISTAGTEASGTSNMKFAMNGGLIIGTLDGANIEIREEIGSENMFVFGAKSEEVPRLRERLHGKQATPHCKELQEVIKVIRSGTLGPIENHEIVLHSFLNGNDHYLVCEDFPSYVRTQDQIDAEFKNKKKWNQKAIMAIAGMGKFSSDRTIDEYAEQIWGLQKIPVSPPQ